VRYRYSSGDDDFTLQFFPPARTSTTPNATFGADRYIKLPRLAVDRADIRNAIAVRYPDSVSGQTEVVTVESSSSIDRYGRMWMSISEPADSAIDTSSEAEVFGQAALDDLSEPDAEQSAEMHLWPVVELGDLYRWTANDVHYNADQDLAVVSFNHELSRNAHRTTLDLRGKARSGTKNWLDKADPIKLYTVRASRERNPGDGTFYPSSSDAVDGLWTQTNSLSTSAVSWADMRTGFSTGLDVTDDGTDLMAGGIFVDGLAAWFQLFRSGVCFDTTPVPPGGKVITGLVSLYTATTDSWTDDFGGSHVVLCPSALTSVTGLSTGDALTDWQAMGTLDQSNRVALSAIPAAADSEVVFTMNSAGMDAVSQGGVTQYSLRWSADVDNSPPSAASTDPGAFVAFHSNENGDVDLRPKLTLAWV